MLSGLSLYFSLYLLTVLSLSACFLTVSLHQLQMLWTPLGELGNRGFQVVLLLYTTEHYDLLPFNDLLPAAKRCKFYNEA